MKKIILVLGILLVSAVGASAFDKDVFKTDRGDLTITFIGHGTLVLSLGGKTIHVDPWSELAEYAQLPKADLILITHEHRDHLDRKAIDLVRKAGTVIIANEAAAKQLPGAKIMKNGDVGTEQGIGIEAVPAYNIKHMRSPGVPFHPKGAGNGYVLTLGGKRVYIAGDTENTPEMKALKRIDIAFLPMNLPYTMTPEMASDAARAFKPGVLYPYHTGDTDVSRLVQLLEKDGDIEIRIRKMR